MMSHPTRLWRDPNATLEQLDESLLLVLEIYNSMLREVPTKKNDPPCPQMEIITSSAGLPAVQAQLVNLKTCIAWVYKVLGNPRPRSKKLNAIGRVGYADANVNGTYLAIAHRLAAMNGAVQHGHSGGGVLVGKHYGEHLQDSAHPEKLEQAEHAKNHTHLESGGPTESHAHLGQFQSPVMHQNEPHDDGNDGDHDEHFESDHRENHYGHYEGDRVRHGEHEGTYKHFSEDVEMESVDEDLEMNNTDEAQTSAVTPSMGLPSTAPGSADAATAASTTFTSPLLSQPLHRRSPPSKRLTRSAARQQLVSSTRMTRSRTSAMQ